MCDRNGSGSRQTTLQLQLLYEENRFFTRLYCTVLYCTEEWSVQYSSVVSPSSCRAEAAAHDMWARDTTWEMDTRVGLERPTRSGGSDSEPPVGLLTHCSKSLPNRRLEGPLLANAALFSERPDICTALKCTVQYSVQGVGATWTQRWIRACGSLRDAFEAKRSEQSIWVALLSIESRDYPTFSSNWWLSTQFNSTRRATAETGAAANVPKCGAHCYFLVVTRTEIWAISIS